MNPKHYILLTLSEFVRCLNIQTNVKLYLIKKIPSCFLCAPLQDLENVTEVLDACSHLQITSALDLCADYMVSLMITYANGASDLLMFLFCSPLQDLENVTEVLDACSHLQITSALDLCADYMVSLITYANASDLLAIADTYSLTRVTDFYEQKVLGNFEEFVRTEQFLALPAVTLAGYLADDR